ncbi:MAG: response regulator transcription factor [Lachnospiraceae bacterium]|nr:response regulator transcription factor [Lachnospiraceae bacterium]
MNNNKYKILIIEDEDNINNLLKALLETSGYQVISSKSCSNGQMLFASHRPDLVILDLGLPDYDGMDFLKEVRKDSLTPIIVLSARTNEKDKVDALDIGANDYVTKPFSSAELMARVRSALRISRRSIGEGKLSGVRFKSGDLEIDYDARRVFVDKTEVTLTQTEYNILAFLSKHSGKVMTYTSIIRDIWGYYDINSTKKLQVNMANIRKKLGDKPGKNNYIVNELGVGYRMCEIDE